MQWCLIAACDMPLVANAPLAALLEKTTRSGGKAILPRTPDGRVQPLCAVYATAALAPLGEALLSGVRKVTEALEGIDWDTFDVDSPRPFANINRICDMQSLE